MSKSTAIAVLSPEQLAAEAQNYFTNVATSSNGLIRTKNKKFMFPDGTEIANEMDVVIVDFVYVNELYPGNFDPKKIAPPICAAKGVGVQEALIPFAESPKLQAESCAECPNNDYGSAGKGKACKNQVWLAVTAADNNPNPDIFTIKLSPTAVAPFKKYLGTLKSHNLPPYAAVTRLFFDKTVDYAKVVCELSKPNHVNENMAVSRGLREKAVSNLMRVTNFTAAE